MAIQAKVRRIGSSLGVILPKRELEARGIQEGDIVEIPKLLTHRGRDLFGVWKDRPARVREAPQ